MVQNLITPNKIGKNCRISHFARFHGNVEIGDNVRIDDFCIFTGNVKIGSNIHIAPYCLFNGLYGIELEDFVQFSARCTLLTGCDDFSGNSMIGPQIPDKYKPGLKTEKIILKKHALLGLGTIVMPGVTLNEGATTGAYSFVTKDIPEFEIWKGNPAKFLLKRSRGILELEKEFINGNCK